MTYKWKIPVFPIDAQSAGEELERIKSTKGRIDPASVLNESRDDGAVLHECFEWDDAVAAEQHRLTQARKIITNIVTVNVGDKRAQEPVRAFVHICDGYKPVAEVMASVAYTEEMLAKALKELLTFRSKYRTLSELQGVMKSIDALETEIEAEKGKEMQLNPVDRPPTQLTASP